MCVNTYATEWVWVMYSPLLTSDAYTACFRRYEGRQGGVWELSYIELDWATGPLGRPEHPYHDSVECDCVLNTRSMLCAAATCEFVNMIWEFAYAA